MDLGCGTGLLGITLARLAPGPSRVVFQDLNRDVLENSTLPNAIVNGLLTTSGNDGTLKLEFLFGSWRALGGRRRSGEEGLPFPAEFDLIVASEVLYYEEEYDNLIRLLERWMRKPGGVALVAGKRHYFGEGLNGGVHSFVSAIERRRFLSENDNRGGKTNVAVHVASSSSSTSEAEVETSRRRLRARVVESVEDGKSNVRDILEIRWVDVI